MSFPYPNQRYTSFLGLSLFGMDEVLADNMNLIDQAYGAGSSINVNGTLVENPNLNGTTPSAPVGKSNVIWQADSNGNVSAYVTTASAAWATLTGDLTETQVIPWDGGTVGTPDTGISRLGAASLAIGNGTTGDFSGSLQTNFLALGPLSSIGQIDAINIAATYPGGTAGGLSFLDISAVITAAPSPNYVSAISIGLSPAVSTSVYALNVEVATPPTYVGSYGAVEAASFAVDINGPAVGYLAQGMQATANLNSPSPTVLAVAYGNYGLVQNTNTGTLTVAYGSSGEVVNSGNGLIVNSYGIFGASVAENGTITNSYGAIFESGATGGTVTNNVAVKIATPIVGGTITNPSVGLLIDDQTASGTLPTSLALQTIGTAPSKFGGSITSGVPGTSTGSIAIASSTASGKYTITVPANAATPTLTLPTTSNVLAGQFAGDNVLYSNTPVGATAAGTLALPTLSTQTANFVFAGPTFGAAAAPTFRALVAADIPATLPLWSNLQNAAGALTLANGANATTFDQTSAVPWTWANTTTATSGTTNASPLLTLAANYWNGSASAADTWTIGASLAGGTNGASTLTFAHTGSSSVNSYVYMPALTVGAPGGKTSLSSLNVGGNGTTGNFIQMFSPASSGGDSYIISNQWSGPQARLYIGNYSNPTALGINTDGCVTVGGVHDAGISRLGAASLAIGKGTAGDTTGALSLSRINAYSGDMAGSVTSAPTGIVAATVVVAVGGGSATFTVTSAEGFTVGDTVTLSAGGWTGGSGLASTTALVGSITNTTTVVLTYVSGGPWVAGTYTTQTGTLTQTGGTSVTVTYNTAYTNTPFVTVTPTSNCGAWYVSAQSTGGFTITYATSGTQTFNYHVIGNQS